MNKPECDLSNCDGNVFAIIGKVRRTLKQSGQEDKADEFATKARQSESYDEVLQLCFKYVDVV